MQLLLQQPLFCLDLAELVVRKRALLAQAGEPCLGVPSEGLRSEPGRRRFCVNGRGKG